MSYHPGKLGVAEAIAVVFMSTFPTIFLTTPAIKVATSSTLAWLEVLIQGIAALVMFFTLCYVFDRVDGDFYTVTTKLLGKIGAWILTLLCIAASFVYYILMMRQFTENTILTALPFTEFNLIVAAYAIIAGLLVYMGLEGVTRATYIIIPFAVIALLVVLLLLAPYYNIYRLAPWAGYGLMPVITNGLSHAGIDIGVFALAIVRPSLQDMHTIRKAAGFGLGLSTILRSFSLFIYLLVFGPAVGQEKVLPFFEMARLVYLSRYLQRVEALFIMLWVITGVIGIALSLYIGLYLLARMLNLPTFRPLIPAVSLLLSILSTIPADITTTVQLYMLAGKTLFTAYVYGVPLLLLAALLYRTKRKGSTRIIVK